MGIETLKVAPSKQEDAPCGYITLIHGIGGHNSCHMTWDDDCGCFTPWQTGDNNTSMGKGDRAGAIAEAKIWAEYEELPMWGVE